MSFSDEKTPSGLLHPSMAVDDPSEGSRPFEPVETKRPAWFAPSPDEMPINHGTGSIN
jgi:hypothetical protein